MSHLLRQEIMSNTCILVCYTTCSSPLCLQYVDGEVSTVTPRSQSMLYGQLAAAIQSTNPASTKNRIRYFGRRVYSLTITTALTKKKVRSINGRLGLSGLCDTRHKPNIYLNGCLQICQRQTQGFGTNSQATAASQCNVLYLQYLRSSNTLAGSTTIHTIDTIKS